MDIISKNEVERSDGSCVERMDGFHLSILSNHVRVKFILFYTFLDKDISNLLCFNEIDPRGIHMYCSSRINNEKQVYLVVL